jgi:DNA-binding NarL/FixJ family response regulator
MDSEINTLENNVGAECRIVLVDDHPIVRDGLIQMMSRQDGLTVCGEASSAEEAFKVIEELKPDLAIVDIFMEGANGIELTKMLHARDASLPILILSMHDEALYAERAIRAGAMGYVMKQEASRTIVDAIHSVMSGKRYVSNHISNILGESATDKGEFNGEVECLSPRELDIFKLIGLGLSRSKIAEKLDISIKTVETHRANMKYKLNAGSAAELKEYAEQWTKTQIS